MNQVAILRATVPMLALAAANCTSPATEAPAAYVSPLRYQHLTCAEIAARGIAVSERLAELSSVQPSEAEKTATFLAGMGKGDGVLPALGEGSLAVRKIEAKTAGRIAQLKGERTALDTVAREKCSTPAGMRG